MFGMFLCSNLPILILQIGLAVFVAVILLILIFSYVVFNKTFGRSKELASESNPIYEQYQEIMKKYYTHHNI